MFTPSTQTDPLHIAIGIPAARRKIVQAASKGRSEAKRALQVRQRLWLGEVIRATTLKPSQIAAAAGVSDTTLTRLMNNPSYSGTLSQLTIDRITAKFGLPGPEEYQGSARATRGGFGEAERFDAAQDKTPIGRAVAALTGDRNGVDPWRLRTSALESAGYLPGDIVLVDLNAEARPRDAVCAQVYDWQKGAANTVFRIYDPPFLVAASRDQLAYKPLLVDNERVVLKGVVLQAIRPERLSAGL